MPLDKDYNSAFFGPNCSRDNALDLNLVLSRIMHYVILGSHSTVKGVCAYKVILQPRSNVCNSAKVGLLQSYILNPQILS